MALAAKRTALILMALSVSFAASPGIRVSSGASQYRIKLDPFVVPPTRIAGIVIKGRVNGGPELRLLLDSATQHVVLDRKAAAKSGCSGGTDLDLIGAGATAPVVVKKQRAQSVQVGQLTLHDVPLLIANRPLPEGIQGVLPLCMFAGFLIRLDIPGHNLELLPYGLGSDEPADALRSVSSNQVLFVKGTVNERSEGYFLVDTGAAYSAISRKVARELNISEMMADRIPLQGGTTDLDAPLLRGSVRLRLGSRAVLSDSVVAVDLSEPSRYHGLDIQGLIGYPALSNSIVTVNYRENYIQIAPR
jgi:hypothetical protein